MSSSMNRVAVVFNKHISHPRYEGLAVHLQMLLQSRHRVPTDIFCFPTCTDEIKNHGAIIPMTVHDAEFLEHNGLAHKALLSPVEVLKQLDDKEVLPGLPVFQKHTGVLPFVPTLQTDSLDEDKLEEFLQTYDRFILKKNTADVSTDQFRMTAEELRRVDLKKYPAYSLQPFLSPHFNISCNFLAKEGVIDLQTFHVYEIPEDFYKQSQKNLQYELQYSALMEFDFCDLSPTEFFQFTKITSIFSHCATVSQSLNLSGMFNFEFLLHKGELFFLEVNPRYSGNIFCRDKSGNHPFLEKVIMPYIRKCGLKGGSRPDMEYDFFSDSKVLYDTTWFEKKEELKANNVIAVGADSFSQLSQEATA